MNERQEIICVIISIFRYMVLFESTVSYLRIKRNTKRNMYSCLYTYMKSNQGVKIWILLIQLHIHKIANVHISNQCIIFSK